MGLNGGLVGGLELGMSSSQLTNFINFERGRSTTNQIMWSNVWDLTHSHLLTSSTHHTSTGCFFRICWWFMGPMMFHPSVDSKVCISSKVSSRYPPGVLQKWVFPPKSSHEFRWFSPWEFMGLSPMFGPKDPKIPMTHGIVPCEAQIRPRAFPAARIRKRRPSATASKNARRPRRCRTCWRTTNELLCIYILLYLYMYNIYIFYKICI